MEPFLKLWVVHLIRQMDTPGVSLKVYWKNYYILNAMDNIKMEWEEIAVSGMKDVWHKIWPSNETYGRNFDNLDMVIKEIIEKA